MKRFLVALVAVMALGALSSDSASAQYPGNFGFQPFGFYQPFGARFSTSIRTPPYFSTNPPVYYGARHARPYGLSPFAAPPQLQAGPGYQSRLRTEFLEPIVPTPGPQSSPCCSNPYLHSNATPATADQLAQAKRGAIKRNPFVTDIDADQADDQADRIAKNET